ncbi:hypothetical protein B484DRAFT_458860, partial [Ochromonadaceae sp. CCMP2298]
MADGRWQMADGRWQMADGRWQMADGRWQMADGWQVHVDGDWLGGGGRRVSHFWGRITAQQHGII